VLILIYQGLWGKSRIPPLESCEFTDDRSRWQEADAIVFHTPQFKDSRCPPRKPQGQLWVGWCLESEANYPILARRAELRAVFDLWMTYRRDSDVWCPYLRPELLEALRNAPAAKTARAPAVAFISSPFDHSGRRVLLDGLMREMPVHSYGRILRNRHWPVWGRAAKQRVSARYKFILAFENSISPDYVTEKFFDPLIVGTVPVYLGAPNVDDFAPGEHCYVDATRFGSARALAAFLTGLAADEAEYSRYLRWKTQPFRPRFEAMANATRVHVLHRLAGLVARLRAERTAVASAAPGPAGA
jgi:alpha-1,3-fucosyltransferase 10